MASTLTLIAQQKTALEQDFLSRQSVAWLQSKMKEVRSPITIAREIESERKRQVGLFQMGGLYHFFYDPLTKGELPYYDIFPLVIPLERNGDGFLGLNLHYLPPRYRAIFMDKLMQFAITNERDEPKRLRVTYDILKATKNYPEMKACLKKYLNSQVRSKILTISPSEWETALFLPTANFAKATPTKVWNESVKKIKRRT